MYEYHGWATIRPTYKSDDVDLLEYDRVALVLKGKVLPSEWPTGTLKLEQVNGDWQFNISGYDNHVPVKPFNPEELFKEIVKYAPGSYGLLYVYNDEDFEHINEFVVYVMSRGQVKQARDPFLSPFIPMVEDEC